LIVSDNEDHGGHTDRQTDIMQEHTLRYVYCIA